MRPGAAPRVESLAECAVLPPFCASVPRPNCRPNPLLTISSRSPRGGHLRSSILPADEQEMKMAQDSSANDAIATVLAAHHLAYEAFQTAAWALPIAWRELPGSCGAWTPRE